QAKAQTTFASLEGTITDQSEGQVQGVSITVTNRETNISRAAVTDDRGFYRASNLPVGIYDVRAEFPGFAPIVQSGVVLEINQTGKVNFALKVSNVEEAIIVEGYGLKVNVVSTDMGQVIDNKQVLDLPLNGRSFDQLLSLVPGSIDGGS